jgi:hypothetical protein
MKSLFFTEFVLKLSLQSSGVFYYLQNVKIAGKSFKISQFLPILATCTCY